MKIWEAGKKPIPKALIKWWLWKLFRRSPIIITSWASVTECQFHESLFITDQKKLRRFSMAEFLIPLQVTNLESQNSFHRTIKLSFWPLCSTKYNILLLVLNPRRIFKGQLKNLGLTFMVRGSTGHWKTLIQWVIHIVYLSYCAYIVNLFCPFSCCYVLEQVYFHHK